MACGSTTSNAVAKRMLQLDLAHGIGPNTPRVWILIVVGGCQKSDFKNREIGDILACGTRTRDAMVKGMPQLDSRYQIGLNAPWFWILIAVGGCQQLEFKKHEIRSRFGFWKQTPRCYGQTDSSIRFGASNRSEYTLGTCSNCSWRMPEIQIKKSRKLETFWLAEPEPAMLWPNRRHGWI